MGQFKTNVFLLLLISFNNGIDSKVLRGRRSIDLSAAHQLISNSKLPKAVVPHSYNLDLRPNMHDRSFHGKIKINATVQEETDRITLHAHHELLIEMADIKVTRTGFAESGHDSSSTPVPTMELKIRRADHTPKKPIYTIYLKDRMKANSHIEIEIGFSGSIWENSEGLFRGSYAVANGTQYYLATYLRPNYARSLFPCFDEPSFKVPFTVSISRPRTHFTLFNTRVISSEPLDGEPETVVDHFETTPPMSTFSLGFVISQLEVVNKSITENNDTAECLNGEPLIQIYARNDLDDGLPEIYERVHKVLKSISKYLNNPYPLPELKLVGLPGLASLKPADNWGLIVMKESDLTSKGYYLLAQEIIYQWIGNFATPYWWSDAHVNKALAGYLAVNTVMEIDKGLEFEGKWPMTVLYSIYYELSKRYPHSKITGMKQESTSSKTELFLRMLNLTLGEDTFKRSIQNFMSDREYKSFFTDDLWDSITKQAHLDGTLDKELSVKDIAGTWISENRIPVVTVNRNYNDKTAKITQKLYLRERPHDVPEQDKMLWYIPLIIEKEDQLCFQNTTPSTWMRKVKEIEVKDMPEKDKFVIVNPEEIGPFMVNYDAKNWNLLAKYLQTESGRKSIPVYTRAKLLHDAWNLAYGGHLSFGTALNMTLFLKSERNHLIWNPVFTMIDHIGRHIDISSVHKKFENYVQILLSPLYEELGPVEQVNEESWKEGLRSLSKNFLCRVGYKPCIEEAQTEFRKWMESENPDEGNPVSNQYICPVFKWGTNDEWEFGLNRIINFPASRKLNERTYLLKNLASCPAQESKIERLLNITIIEENGNFTENDIFLIFNMLSGGSTGYKTLFHFLSDNWEIVKHKFENKTNLWENLISSATGAFTTQEGYDLVSHLYVHRQGEFGSAERIIEKSLKNIKEETKWSDENLPVISRWLDEFLKATKSSSNKLAENK